MFVHFYILEYRVHRLVLDYPLVDLFNISVAASLRFDRN